MTPADGESVIFRASDQTVWPWQAEPYRLWSLLDVANKFIIGHFASHLINFERACAFSELAILPRERTPPSDVVLRDAIPHYIEALTGLLGSVSTCSIVLSPAVELQLQRLLLKLRNTGGGADYHSIVAEARVARQALLDDLSSQLFLHIEWKHREHYEQREYPLGAAVASTFPDAAEDISAAGRCLAIGEGTACVFHLMRVLEHGLRSLAMRVGLSVDVMGQENWKNVIDQIEKQVRGMEARPRSTDKTLETQHLSEACAQFRYFKDAWRNHVSHSKASYDSRESESVWIHVSEFMKHLAEGA